MNIFYITHDHYLYDLKTLKILPINITYTAYHFIYISKHL